MNTYFVYIMTNRPRGVLYTGVTRDLVNRVFQHRNAMLPRFTERYNMKTLVWYEAFGDIHEAITREKRIKRWRRAWKIALIEQNNPGWLDLWYNIAVKTCHPGRAKRDPGPHAEQDGAPICSV